MAFPALLSHRSLCPPGLVPACPDTARRAFREHPELGSVPRLSPVSRLLVSALKTRHGPPAAAPVATGDPHAASVLGREAGAFPSFRKVGFLGGKLFSFVFSV